MKKKEAIRVKRIACICSGSCMAASSPHGRVTATMTPPTRLKMKEKRFMKRKKPQNSRRGAVPEKAQYFFVRHRMKYFQREGRVVVSIAAAFHHMAF